MGDRLRPAKARLATGIVFFIAASIFLVPAEAAGLFVIRGSVTDVDGTPIAGATVRGDYSERSATTDASGDYFIEYLTPDTDYLVVSAPGHYSKSRYVDSLTQRDPVDFYLSHRVVASVTPNVVESTDGLTVTMTAQAGPRDDICMSMTVPGSSSVIALPVTTGESASTGTALHSFTTILNDGNYLGTARAYPCEDPYFTLGSGSFSFRVDSKGPAYQGLYPTPDSIIPADEIIPTFVVSDPSGVKSTTISLVMKDLTAETERVLTTSRVSGAVKGERVAIEEGHSYLLIASAEDNLGHASVKEWGFSASAAVAAPPVVMSAPYDYGERCERLISSSCIGEPSAIGTGSIRIASSGASATNTAFSAGYLYMGAGIRYTVPRTGEIEVTAEFAEADGVGMVCAAAFKGDMDPVGVACEPISAGSATLQFRGLTGQALKIGGYLMPVCTGDETASNCTGGALARVTQVSLTFRGSS